MAGGGGWGAPEGPKAKARSRFRRSRNFSYLSIDFLRLNRLLKRRKRRKGSLSRCFSPVSSRTTLWWIFRRPKRQDG